MGVVGWFDGVVVHGVCLTETICYKVVYVRCGHGIGGVVTLSMHA